MIFHFLWLHLKLIIQKLFHRDFQNTLSLPVLPRTEAIMKMLVQLTCIAISLKVLDSMPIFFGIAHHQERGSFVCKHWWSQEEKKKVYIFVYKIFNKAFLNTTVIAMWCPALAKWSHSNVKSLFIFNSLAINAIMTVFSICTGNIAFGCCTNLASSLGT